MNMISQRKKSLVLLRRLVRRTTDEHNKVQPKQNNRSWEEKSPSDILRKKNRCVLITTLIVLLMYTTFICYSFFILPHRTSDLEGGRLFVEFFQYAPEREDVLIKEMLSNASAANGVLLVDTEDSDHTTENTTTAQLQSDSIPVFYNLFTKSPRNVKFVKSIVKEQLAYRRHEHQPLFVRSVGVQFDIENATHIQHDDTGDEIGTLSLLWNYCKKNPNKKVVYIHSKGSFHPWKMNTKLRKFLTRGALSEDCANLPSSCNVCSSRMSPLPHPHTSGNMWLARCNYVQKLIEPYAFERRMGCVANETNANMGCIGLNRYASEHWIHSHPSVMPCDLASDPLFTWSYDNIPEEDFKIDLKQAPRFELKVYKKDGVCDDWGFSLDERLREYNILYSQNVTESWWGWNLFQIQYNERLLPQRIRSQDCNIVYEISDNKNESINHSISASHEAVIAQHPNHIFCSSCKYRPDNNTMTCGEQLALVESTFNNVHIAKEYIMSNGYHNCSIPNVTLVQIPKQDEDSVNSCFKKRGLSGKWVQDLEFGRRNVYPNHRPYTSTKWHIADSMFSPTPESGQLYSYNTYRWVDDSCPVTEISLGGFCQVMNRLNMTQILIIGDSLSMQFRKALEAMLGFPFASLDIKRDWLASDEVIIPCNDVKNVPNGFSIKIFMLVLMPYRDSVSLDPAANRTKIEEIFRDSAARLSDPKKLQLTLLKHFNKVDKRKKWIESNHGMNRTVLVMNIGAWMDTAEKYKSALKGLFAWIDTLPKDKIVPFFRDTLPGHPECDPSGDRKNFDWNNYPDVKPYTSHLEYIRETDFKRNRPQSMEWPIYWKYQSNGTFQHYNEWTKEIIAQRPESLVKINWLNVYNSSILRRDGLIGFSDCLHHNLPGPRDFEVHMFYSALLDMAQLREAH